MIYCLLYYTVHDLKWEIKLKKRGRDRQGGVKGTKNCCRGDTMFLRSLHNTKRCFSISKSWLGGSSGQPSESKAKAYAHKMRVRFANTRVWSHRWLCIPEWYWLSYLGFNESWRHSALHRIESLAQFEICHLWGTAHMSPIHANGFLATVWSCAISQLMSSQSSKRV